jgi:ferredoxin-like protein FixX
MRADGIFIAVEVSDAEASDTALAAKLTEACPVDIFAQAGDGTLSIVQKNLDECVLCGLCMAAAGGRDSVPVKIIKLYDGETVLAQAS